MDNKDKIRSAVAQFFKVPEAEVTEGFVFPAARLQGAVGRSALQAALKRIAGVDLAAAFTANTYGELVNAPGARPSSGAAVLAVGIDLGICAAVGVLSLALATWAYRRAAVR